MLARLKAWCCRPRSARNTVLWLSAFLALATNWPLWIALASLHEPMSYRLAAMAGMVCLVFLGTAALLTLTAWGRWMKPLWMGVVAVAAVAQYYMWTFRIVVDPSMIANVLQTDVREARDVLDWRLLLAALAVCVPAFAWLACVRIRPQRLWPHLWRNGVQFAVIVALAVICIVGASRVLAPLMRNHTQLRYMMNPLASLYSVGHVALQPLFKRSGRIEPISAAAVLGPASAKPPLLVLVVGETARADHFALNGYARDTTPALAKREVLSFRNVYSCGTNTIASVPCMFSHLGKSDFESRDRDYENLLDVLQAAGLAVFWLDNQSGCKDVCGRIPYARTNDAAQIAAYPALCEDGNCLDLIMLEGLDSRLAALPSERRAKGIVLVMHQIGSHGPAYFRRSSPAQKRFMPECTNLTISACSQEELINAYDNSIFATDDFLGATIDWLKKQSDHYDTGLLYLSDHGESLGEMGLYLHGLPYRFAPDAQKHVPMVMWFAPGWLADRGLRRDCLEAQRDAALSHDNFYHTVLGLMDVRSPTYKRALDALAMCRLAIAAQTEKSSAPVSNQTLDH